MNSVLRLPNFLIVGAQKCGTTVLHNTLKKHPEFFMSEEKELNFFNMEKNYSKGLDFYAENFSSADEHHRAIGESSPGYICYPNTAKRIRKELINVKIIILLRDPIKRALSQYWHNRRNFNEPDTFEKCIDKYLVDDYLLGGKGYFTRGLYHKYIDEYKAYFPADDIYIGIFEKLVTNQQAELNKIINFLGFDNHDWGSGLSAAKNSSMVYDNYFYRYMFDHPEVSHFIPKRFRRVFMWGVTESFKYPIPDETTLNRLREYYEITLNYVEKLNGSKLKEWTFFYEK